MSESVNSDETWKKLFQKGAGLRIVILKILEYAQTKNEPVSAYDIQSYVYKSTFFQWKPSPGSIYPILDELIAKNFVSVISRENKDYYSLTITGKTTFHEILAAKFLTDVYINALLFDLFDIKSIKLPCQLMKLDEQIEQISAMMGNLMEQNGINSDNIRLHFNIIEKEFQKGKIVETITGVDKYVQLLNHYKLLLMDELKKLENNNNSI